MRFWNRSITTKVASAFLLLSLATTGVVGGVAFYRARAALKQAAFDRLSVSATLKEAEIARWFEKQQRDFFLITQFPDVQRNLQKLLSSPSPQETEAAYGTLSAYLQNIIEVKSNFQEIFVLDLRNKVVVSTSRNNENQYIVNANATYLYLQEVQPGDTFDPIFYVSLATGKPAVTLAAPLYDDVGDRQGAVLVHLDLDEIDQIVRERTGLGDSGESYLVGSLVNEFTFISRDIPIEPAFSEDISSPGIDAAMRGTSGYGLYTNYADVPVIGVYRWLQDQDIALLVEMRQEEAFAPARQLAGTIMLVVLISVMGLAVGIRWLARQLQLSHEKLEQYSHQLEQKAQEADAANRAKSQFLANMSHELRTPLNAILGFAQLIAREPEVPQPQREQIQIINRSGEHLLTLINDVLEMSKIEADRISLSENDFNLHWLLQLLEEMFLLKAQAKGLTLKFEHEANVPRNIHADEGKLRQVLINLIGNAIKFTEAGHVVVRTQVFTPASQPASPCPTLTFAIEDTGLGIAAEELKTLFEPFVQTETGRTSQQGTGLGLPISQKFVQLMGGRIRVASTLGQGSQFVFDIPLQLAKAVEETAQPPQRVIGLTPNQPTYRLLIVEDHWENRQLLKRLLSPLGFELREAENGREALSVLATWTPHLIWMDIRMPVMDGYEATQRIRAMERDRKTGNGNRRGSGRVEEWESGGVGQGWESEARSQESTIGNREQGTGNRKESGVKSQELGATSQDLPAIFGIPNSSHIIIIALTASAFEEARADILAAGCDDFVRKPFQEHVLFDKMAQYLGIQYVYAEDQETEVNALGTRNNGTSPATKLSPTSLQSMPSDWVEQLSQAAIRADAEDLRNLIRQIPSEHANLAKALTILVEQFQFEELIELVDSAAR
ncbi:MAG: ATP-binding protein [Cyanobacteria bacterium J06626_18]